MKLYDISTDLTSSRLYPGTRVPKLLTVSDMPDSLYRVSELVADLHTGTHVDAPRHCICDGDTVGELSLELFIGKAIVFDLALHHIVDLPIANECCRLLLKSAASFPLSMADCAVIKSNGYVTVGTDDITVGSGDKEYDIHRFFLSSGMGVIENLSLTGVGEGIYFLFAPPIKIDGAEAAFCRAVLMGVNNENSLSE